MSTLQTAFEALDGELARGMLRAAAILLAGALLARFVRRRLVRESMGDSHRMLLRRIIGAGIYGVALAWALSELGLNIGVVLGAAGVLTVAVGFAAQTAFSNLISGIFLMVEQPFQIADVIKVGETTGEVIAIDLLSTKLRTFDNLYVRIPNETMIKAQVTNITHFPIRRLDMQIGVAYREDIARVRQVLLEVADKNVICLEEPCPTLIFLGYGDSSLNLQFSVWAARDRFLELRNTMHEEVKNAFDANKIEIPFPHRTLFVGTGTDSLPVDIARAS